MKYILLDRDGTIIRDPADLRVESEDEIEFFHDTLKSMKLLAENDYAVVMITNQAGISEGLIDAAEFDRINNKVIDMMGRSGVKVLKTFMCPHSVDDGCECRKPKPKMLIDAIKEFELKSSEIFMVGDRKSDIEAGLAAGCKTILVKTANEVQPETGADYTVDSLFDAVQIIVG